MKPNLDMELKAETMNILDRVIVYDLFAAVERNAIKAYTPDIGCSVVNYCYAQRLNALLLVVTKHWFSTDFTNWIYDQLDEFKESEFYCLLRQVAKETFFNPSEEAVKKVLKKYRDATIKANPDTVAAALALEE